MENEAYESAKYLPFGDDALLIEFGETISLETNQKVVALNEAILEASINGIEELVPTYRSLLVRYNPLKTAYEQLVFRTKDTQRMMEEEKSRATGRRVTIPVIYGGRYGPDLGNVARYHGLTEEQVVHLHSKKEYRVYMIGFVAGFPYLGEVSDEIATPRLETPRLKVPAGSVGIAEKQTGIYPCEAPGGWQIIGRTSIKLFNPSQQPPALLEPGDLVGFKPIFENDYKTIQEPTLEGPLDSVREKNRVFDVLKPGFLTTVQDMGRYGYLKYGVPISGAMDTFSCFAANLLVDNRPNSACLEITLIGPELQALRTTQIAVTGGCASLKINEKSVPMWQTLTIEEGDIISFGRMESGCRAYLSVRGGIDTRLVLGSRSTYVRGGFGGINGRQLKIGDTIEAFNIPVLQDEYKVPEELVPQFTNHCAVHVILGPQVDMFTEKGIDTFLSSQYKVTPEADRMGYRLDGLTIEHRAKADIVSDALLPGAIQVPKIGKPIIIMRDAQTTGGYAKIAVAINPDVDLLGQAKPNDVIEFLKITTSQARQKSLEYCKMLSSLRRKKEHSISQA